MAYSILEFQQFAGETSMDSYIWDIGKNLFEELQLSYMRNYDLDIVIYFFALKCLSS